MPLRQIPNRAYDAFRATARNLFYFQLGLKAAGLAAAILIAHAVRGLPRSTDLVLAALFIGGGALDVVAWRRRAAIFALGPVAMVGIDPQPAVGEAVRLVMPHVMEQAVSLKPLAYGNGTVTNVTNALVVTDKTLYAVHVPLEGSGIVAGNSVANWQWMHRSHELGVEAARLATLPLAQLLDDVTTMAKFPLPLQAEWLLNRATVKITGAGGVRTYMGTRLPEMEQVRAAVEKG